MDIKIQPHLTCVPTLPCETLMSAKPAINHKLQGSELKKGLLLSLSEKNKSVNILKSVNIWQSYKQESDCLVHRCAWPTHC